MQTKLCDACKATGGTPQTCTTCGGLDALGWRVAGRSDAARGAGPRDLGLCPDCSDPDGKACPVCCGAGSVQVDGSPVPRVADRYRPIRAAGLRDWLARKAKRDAETAAKLAEGGLL